MPRHHKHDRDDNRRNRRDRDRSDRFALRTDADRSDNFSGASASATLESSSDDPIISGGRSASQGDWDRHDQHDDVGSDHDDDHDGDRYGRSVTYHDDSDDSYGSSDSHHDSHDDSDHLSLIAPTSNFF